MTDATAVVEGNSITIKLSFDNMKAAVLGYNMITETYDIIVVKDGEEAQFAKDVCDELNREDETGSTPIHRMFDEAFEQAIEYGAGVEITEEELQEKLEALRNQNETNP